PHISTARPIACAVGDEVRDTAGAPSAMVLSGRLPPPSRRADVAPGGSVTPTGCSPAPAEPPCSACSSGPSPSRAKAYSVDPFHVWCHWSPPPETPRVSLPPRVP